ncbi:cyclin-dependent kinase 4 inhibitor B [Lampris incognitus]|uniref:cyclin-dependent kinase 4 inhibitor B n=1 Tax=Lampris incognitus TaxID=2546036 RepID=UPI0024B5E5D4|nr:cyclin-dependent kinase 4 inhibitor B [Lampris incognitus]
MTMTLEDELTSAAAMGDAKRVEYLLQTGADVNGVNCFGRTALQVMMMGSASVARLLLARGADPNVTDMRTGTTPLHDAARAGFVDTVQILVHSLADPNARDNTDCRPVDLARQCGHSDVATFLESL